MRQRERGAFLASFRRGNGSTSAVKTVALLLLILVACGAAARPCTNADIIHFFSPCDKRTGKLTVLSYLSSDADCERGNLFVPPPRTTACYDCTDGYRLDPLTLECAVCPAGTYSSYTTRYVTFDPLPEDMRTYCSPEPCASWSAVEDTYGTVVSSGVQPTENRPVTQWGTVDESVESTLDFVVDVIESSGSLEFDYSISSEEMYDGLVLRLNYSIVRNPDTEVGKYRFFATGVHRDWYHASLRLPYGTTQIQFDYMKDSTGPPYGEELTGVNDRALLRNIVVKGTRKTVAEMQCVSCPPGHWTAREGRGGVGASQCVRCPRNTYRGEGDTQCLQCPPNTSSPEGANNCTRMRACTGGDYIAQYGSCRSDNTRLRSWVKYEGADCAEVEGSRPTATRVECATCLPGMRHADSRARGACVSCPAGEYLLGDRCEVCPLGTAAIPKLVYSSGFDGLGGDVMALPGISLSRIYCTGSASRCRREEGKGFELVGLPFADEDNTLIGIRQEHLASSTYSLATLSYTFHAEEDGWANITFAYVDAEGKYVQRMDWRTTLNVRVIVDDNAEYPVRAFASHTGRVDSVFYSLLVPYYVDTALPASGSDSKLRGMRHRLSWIVEELAFTSNPISVVIVGLEVFGDVSGGVQTCQPCRAGFSCASRAAKMTPCSPGTVQPALRAHRCEPCIGNTYAPGYGFTTCLQCPGNTVANADHTGCSLGCVFERNGMVYNFSELRGVVLNASVGYMPATNASVSNMTVEEADEAGIPRFYFSPCDPLPVRDARATSESDSALTPITRDRLCVPSARGRNSSSSAYVCQRTSATNGHHFGDAVVHMEVGRHLYLVTQLGSPYIFYGVDTSADDWVYDAKSNYMAFIELECSTSGGEPKFGTLQYVGEGNEDLVLRWRSAYACPLCTNESYEKVETSCDDPTATTRRVYYTLRRDSMNCVGGYVPPEPIIVKCTECTLDAYTVRWLECDPSTQTQEGVYVLLPDRANCTPGASPLPPVKPRPCDASGGTAGRGTSRRTVVVLLVVLGLVLAGLGVMTFYYRRLRERVARAARGEGAELDAYGGILDDPYDHDDGGDPAEPSSFGRDSTAATVHQLWGVVVSMGQHIRDAVSHNDGRSMGAAARASADDRNNWNRYDFAAASDGGSSESGGGSGSGNGSGSADRDGHAQNFFSLAATDDDILPGLR
ncbi:conserved hypothetical protein [Leishmania infantum JPCM5]|uniref:Uncharacterized protein n=3 Tax=Leishmania donovani species complex TaxID=38574 RepID=A4HZR9_LEIIN|nr:conserved hypothetical protein [Leishmania infantum JPCM5]CAC9487672.1 hypothetical_protein_-_conserved [Leishmania infantum]CAM67983.1 conserved hypothetical protein [Leishmania infantum JPCM5]SUZ41731.1 hypothetical_protein_-_conserved [Leishmania infantum]|eukprot:XP_001465560.1 conserved hypothetical protein [Leishmania infantum JPCM5]